MTDPDLLELPASVPYAVQNRLQSVIDTSKERHAALTETSAQMRAARTALLDDRERLIELERGKRNKDQLAQVQVKIDRGEKALAELIARIEKLGPSWDAAHRLSSSLQSYVRSHAAGSFALHDGDTPQLRNGEKAVDGLERVARHTRTLQADRREVLAAPLPSAVAKQLAREQLTARVDAAKPDVSSLVDQGGSVKFPTSRVSINQFGGNMDIYTVDPVGLLAWIFPAEVQAAIDREIDANSDDAIALSAEERIERLALIDGDILASEREEAAFAELAGLLPRPDIDPRAALGLSASMPAPARD